MPSPPAPDSYRPWVRWWWNGDKVERAELIRELHLLHEAGVGGVEINPIEFPSKRCDDLGKPSLTWLSDEWLDMLEVVLKEARQLGMGCDLLVGSGWPFGRESLPMDERAQVMLTYVAEVQLSAEKPYAITRRQIFDAVDPKVTEANADRQFALEAVFVVPDTITDIRQRHDLPLPVGDTIMLTIADTGSPSPTGRYLFYALVRCTSFASVINGAPGASGPILDHLNADAVRHFLYDLSQRLEGRLGPMRRWLRAYFVDSMELEGANWTGDFAEEFRRRRGYDLMPWLPFTMFKTGRLGDVVSYDYGARQSPDFRRQVQQVRHDFELTKAELLYERFTLVFAQWCREQGVLSRGQAYGRGFFPLLSSTAYDIPEGESWTTNYLRHRVGEEMPDSDYRRGRAYTMIDKYVSSAAHQSGKRVVSAEEMTNTYRVFETTLELLKVGSDMSAFSGVTHSVWHGFNYSPPEAGFPGWVQYGSYLNEKNTWWNPYFRLLNDYRARTSAILQNADMLTDIAILLPLDTLWAQYGVQTEPFPNYPKGSVYDIPCLLWEAVHKNGGNCDLLTPRQLSGATVHEGSLKVGNRAYKALLLPPNSVLDSGQRAAIGARLPVVEVPDLPDRHYLDWYATAQAAAALPHAVSIEKPDPYLLQNRYRNDRGDDIFLFSNASLRKPVGSRIAFHDEIWQGRTAWVYNAATDEKRLLPLEGGGCELYMPPAESLFVLFERSSADDIANARTWTPVRDSLMPHFSLQTSWHVTLRHAIEPWQRDTVMQQLCDLRTTPYKDFSGTIVYTARFHIDSLVGDARGGMACPPESLDCLDLGEVYDICHLKVNGKDCGVKWYGERRYDNLGGLLHAGDNSIEITVVTTLNNYVHTLTDNGVVQHFVLKRNVPTSFMGLMGPVRFGSSRH